MCDKNSPLFELWTTLLYESSVTADPNSGPVLYQPPAVMPTLMSVGLENVIKAIDPPGTYSPVHLFGTPIDLDEVDEYGRSALLLAIHADKQDTALKLLECGATPTSIDLFTAIKHGNSSVIMGIVAKNSDLMNNELNHSGVDMSHSPLFLSLFKSIEIFDAMRAVGEPKWVLDGGLSILHWAAMEGDLSKIQHIFNSGIAGDVDRTNDDGYTALHLAIDVSKSLPICEYLVLEKHADPHLPSASGITPISCAAYKDLHSIVAFLLQHGCDMRPDANLWTPLHCAAYRGSESVVQCFIDAKFGLDNVNSDGDTALLMALTHDHTVVAAHLIKAGARVGIPSKDGSTALLRASVIGHTDIVRLLLSKGADSMVLHEKSFSCLHMAAFQGHVAVVDEIVVHRRRHHLGIDEVEDTCGWTPLHTALARQHTAVATLLVNAGARLNLRDHQGHNVLYQVCCYTLDQHLFDMCIQHMADEDVHALSEHGRSALHAAAENGNFHAVKRLLADGLDSLAVDSDGFTPLHLAAISGNSEVVKILLACPNRPDLQSKDGWTALLSSCVRGDQSTVESLLAVSNWVLRRPTMDSAPVIAAAYGNLDALKALSCGGVPLNSPNRSGWTALDQAALDGNDEIVVWLLDNGADITRVTTHCLLPFTLGLEKLEIGTLERLLTKSPLLFRENHH